MQKCLKRKVILFGYYDYLRKTFWNNCKFIEFVLDEAEKPRSILKNTQQPSGNKKEFDEQFNAFYEHMNDSDSECNDEELEDEEELVDEALLENFADDYQDEKEKGKDIVS